MHADETAKLFGTTLSSVTDELFEAHGIEARRSADTLTDPLLRKSRAPIARQITFDGPRMQGRLCLFARDRVVEALAPEELASEPMVEELLVDVLGEWANELLGRLKNRMRQHGVPVVLSTPTAVDASPPDALFVAQAFAISVGLLHVRLDIRIDAHIDGAESSGQIEGQSPDGSSEPPLAEGDCFMF